MGKALFDTRWCKIWRDLWANKTRTALVALSIAVGVFAIGVTLSSREALLRALNDSYVAANLADSTIYTTTFFGDDLVEVARGARGVLQAEGRCSIVARLNTGPGEWRPLLLTAVADYDDIQINKIWPESDAWPPPDQAMLVERAALGMTGATVGDTVLVETLSGVQRELRIAGLVHDPGRYPARFVGSVYGYVTLDTLEWLGESRRFNELHITVAEKPLDTERIQSVTNRVQDQVEEQGQSIWGTEFSKPGEHPTDDIVRTLALILEVLSFSSVFLSGFLVTNTVWAFLVRQVQQIGVMKAIGACTNQLMGMYLTAVLVYGGLALLIAVPLGILGAQALTAGVARLLNLDAVASRVPWYVFALQTAVGLAVPFLAAFPSIISGTRITVREATSTHGLNSGQSGASLVDRLIERVRGLPRPFLLSLRNTFRHKGRLVLTLVTLTLASATFVAVFSVRASLILTLNSTFERWNDDIRISFTRPYRVDRVEREALSVPGVVKAEGWGFASARRQRDDDSESRNLWIFAPPGGSSMFRPAIIEGRWLLPKDEGAIVINTELLKEEPDIEVGDEVRFKIEGRDMSWRVVGIIQGAMEGPLVYTNYSYLASITRQVGRVRRVHIVTERHDAAFESQVAQALEQHFRCVGMHVDDIYTSANEYARLKSIFDVVVGFLSTMAILLALVGGLGLMGTMSINVLDRTREIGVMRAVGASDGAVLRIVVAEGVFIGVISWMLGGVLALPLGKVLSDIVGMALLQTPLIYTFSESGILIWFVAMVFFAAQSSFFPAWNATRIKVREALAYE